MYHYGLIGPFKFRVAAATLACAFLASDLLFTRRALLEYDLYRGAYFTPQAGFRLVAANPIGQRADFSRIARSYLSLPERGYIGPLGDTGVRWLAIFDGMYSTLGRDTVHRVLSEIDVSRLREFFA